MAYARSTHARDLRAGMETNLKAIELRDLWRRYKDDGTRGSRAPVLAYAPLVKYVAGRMSSGLPRTSRSPT